jgi:H+/gluconate symporter-like permease
MSVGDTMKTWSISETLIAVIGLLLTLGLSVVI